MGSENFADEVRRGRQHSVRQVACRRVTSEMTGQPETIRLVGAGLNGPLLAIFLARRGFRVEIYGLAKAGLWSAMQNIIIPMKGRMIHSVSGELSFQPYGKDANEVIYSISRAELNMAVFSPAEA